MKSIQNLVKWFAPKQISLDSTVGLRVTHIIKLTLIGLGILFSFAFLYFKAGLISLAIYCTILLVVCIALLFYYRKTSDFKLIGSFLPGMLYGLILISIIETGGLLSPGLPWLVLPFIVELFYGKAKRIKFWVILCIITVIFFLVLEEFFGVVFTSNSSEFWIKLIHHFVSIGLILFIYFIITSFETEIRNLIKKLTENANRIKERNLELEIEKRTINLKNRKLKKYQAKLKTLNETKDNLFSIISHDLKSPINTLLGFSTLIIDHGHKLSKDEIIDHFTSMNKSFKSIDVMLTDLLTWARVQKDNVNIKLQKLNITQSLQQVISQQKIMSDLKKIKIYNEIPEDIFINSDKNIILTVFRNLLSNAIKFTPDNGEIKILYGFRDEIYNITFKDTGIGIETDVLGKLFELDKKVTNLGTRGEKGHGVGLLLCQDLLNKIQCKIDVKSSFGNGSEFSVLFLNKKVLTSNSPLSIAK